jgi:L-malate glycosyltransferase
MKILFFNYEYPPLGGGAGNATFYIMQEFAKIPDLEVDLITSSIDDKRHIENISDNIRIHRIPIGKNQANLHYQSQKELIIYAIKAYFYARKLVIKAKRANNPYQMTHSFFSIPCGQISWILKKQYGLPYTVSLRGSDVPGYSAKFSAVYKILNPLIKKVWADADRVVSVSSGLKELALHAKPDQHIEVIVNGINIDEFTYDPNARDIEKFRILCVSRLTPRKGIHYLIESTKYLKNEYPNIQVDIVGDGEQHTELTAKAHDLELNDHCIFHGLVPHDEITPFYKQASIFVLPSANEGMSNTMLEALACGLPLVATDTGGTRELVRDGENGFIIKMKDPEDIAEKIKKIMTNDELRIHMAEASRHLAEQMSWKNVAEKYVDLYQEVTKK